MASSAATLLLLGLLVPTVVVFVAAYRHALRVWLRSEDGPALPVATIGRRPPRPAVPLAHRFHAAIIATAFASVFVMSLVAFLVIATIVASA